MVRTLILALALAPAVATAQGAPVQRLEFDPEEIEARAEGPDVVTVDAARRAETESLIKVRSTFEGEALRSVSEL